MTFCFGETGSCRRTVPCQHACELRVQVAHGVAFAGPLFDANRHTCRTCRHWEQRYPQNSGLGACLRVSVMFWEKNEERDGYVSLSVPMGMRESNPPLREEPFPTLNTVQDFGCTGYERNAA